MRSFRVLIVDDSPVFLQAARSILMDVPGLEIIGWASSGAEALELAALTLPDLILTDLSMPEMDGIELTRRLIRTSVPPAVVIMTGHMQPAYRSAAMSAGVSGFVLKSDLNAKLPILLRRLIDNARPNEGSENGLPRE